LQTSKWWLFGLGVALVLGICGAAELHEAKVYNQSQPAKANSAHGPSGNLSPAAGTNQQAKKGNEESHWYDTFSDDPTDWLLVAFNGILAIFTARLFYAATEQSRDIKASVAVAKRSADIAQSALVELEAPFLSVRVLDPGFRTRMTVNGQNIAMNVSFPGLRLSFCFDNYGRTPASLIEYRGELQATELGKMPAIVDPNVGKAEQFGVMVGPNRRSTALYRLFRESPSVAGNVAKIGNDKELDLFFIGFAKYADIFGGEYLLGFCFRFDWTSGSFLLTGGTEYNYRKKTKQPTPPNAVG